MERLIDADKLADEFYHMPELVYTDAIARCIEMQPTVDAVQVVRCKDCKHGHECYGVGMSSIVCEFSNYMNSPNGFCHEGERKDDKHDDG